MTEYRQNDTTDGYCPRCGQPLAAMTTGARGYCETHGWQYAEWYRETAELRRAHYAAASDRDPGDETTDEKEGQP